MADFFGKIGELYRSIQTRLHAILLRISIVVPLVAKVTDMERSPCRIALARKRVSSRIVYRRKFTVFTIYPDSSLSAIREMKANVSGYNGLQRGLLKDKQQK